MPYECIIIIIIIIIMFMIVSLNLLSVTPVRENDVAGIDVNMGCPKDYSCKVSEGNHL